MRKDPPELIRRDPPELLSDTNSSYLNNESTTKTTIKPDQPFAPSLLIEPSSYANDVQHHWLSILLSVCTS
jgi:hypothetical protein